MKLGVRDLRDVFKDVYYHIYTNDAISRAERLMAELTKVLHCLLVDSSNGVYGLLEKCDKLTDRQIAHKIREVFELEKKRGEIQFRADEKILLGDKSIAYLVRKIVPFDLKSLSLDVLAGAFETLIHPSVRGDKGQFFTPRNLVNTIVEILDPKPYESIIDPACGTGGFLVASATHLGRENIGMLTGVDKDFDMFRLTTTYLETLGIESYRVINGDSLDIKSVSVRNSITDESYDIVITNPPFGTRIQVTNQEVLRHYQLGHKWRRIRSEGWHRSGQVLRKQHPQILFIERCLQLLKPKGRMAIILPEGVFASSTNGYVWAYVNSIASIDMILDCPRVTFQPSTDTKTNVVFLRKCEDSQDIGKFHQPIMSIADYCGYDRRGRPISNNDFPKVVKQVKSLKIGNHPNKYGFKVKISLTNTPILVPRYYDPELQEKMESCSKNGDTTLVPIGNLMRKKILKVRRGNEVGSEAYDSGDIPFIRTSDMNNWEITHNPTNCVSADYYKKYDQKQQLRPFDILFVNDGRYRIGKACILGEKDTKIVVQSHIRIITVRTPNEYNLDPFLFLYLLSHPLVKKQISAKTFVHSTIASLGSRLKEILLPLPTNRNEALRMSNTVRNAIKSRQKSLAALRDLMGLDYVEV